MLQEIAFTIGLDHLTVRERLQLLVDRRREAKPEMGVTDDMASEAMVQDAFTHLDGEQRKELEVAFEQIHALVGGLIQQGIENGEFRQLPLEIIQYVFWQLFQPQVYPTSVNRVNLEHGWLEILFNGIAN